MGECIKKIEKESKLYKSLLSIVSKDIAENIIEAVNSPDFSTKYGHLVNLRDGEPTVSSILNISQVVRESVDMKALIPILNKEWGLTDESGKTKFIGTAILDRYKRQVATSPIGEIVDIELSKTDTTNTGVEFNQATFTPKKATIVDTLQTKIGKILTGAHIPQDTVNNLLDSYKDNIEGLSVDLEVLLKESYKNISGPIAEFITSTLLNQGSQGAKRLLYLISANNLAPIILGDSYETFVELLNKDGDKINQIAMSKIIQDLFSGEDLKYPGMAPTQLDSIKRLAVAVKNNWTLTKNNIPLDALTQAISEAEGITMTTKEVLEDSTVTRVNAPRPVKTKIEIIAEREQSALRKALKAEIIRQNQFSSNKEFSAKQAIKIKELLKKLKMGTYKIGLYDFIKNANAASIALTNRLEKIQSLSLKDRLSQLRNLHSYVTSYLPVLNEILDCTDKNSKEFKEVYSPEMLKLLEETKKSLESVMRQFNALSSNAFLEVLAAEYGQDFIEIKTGSRKGKYYFSDLINNMGPDIGTSDLWLNALASTPDLIGKVIDSMVQKTNYSAYDKVVNTLRDKMQSIAEKLFEEQGNRDTSWMFERDSTGNLTGYYIREIDYAKYEEASNKVLKEIKSTEKDPTAIKRRWDRWKIENTEPSGNQPKLSLYRSEAYTHLTEAQKNFYEAFLKTKREMDNLIGNTDHYKAIQIRKDFVQRLTSGNVKDLFKQTGNTIKDSLVRRVDDTDMAYKAVPTDFENNPIYSLPIYYVKSLENLSDLSTDAFSSLFAYTSMAVRYEKLNEIIDALEIGKTVLEKRKAYKTTGDKILSSRLMHIGDETFFDPVTLEGVDQQAFKRFVGYMTDQVYQRGSVDAGTFMGVDVQKGTNALLTLSTIKSLGFKLTVGLASITSGLAFTRTEAIAGQFFNMKDMAQADYTYFANIMPLIADLGTPFKSNKLSLFLEKFNISQEGLQGLRGKDIEKSTLARLFGMKTFMFFLGAADHYLNSRVAIAMANNVKLKNADGSDITLWEALETKPLDENNPDGGAKLVLKEGVTNQDGSTVTTQDYFNLSRRFSRLIQRITGNINEGDRGMAKMYVLGKVATQFRNFMIPNWNARFQQSNMDIGLGLETEGYYRTTARVLKNLLKDLRQGRMLSLTDLTDTERYNLKRTFADIGQFAAVAFLFKLLAAGWKDKDHNPWYKRLILFQIRRLQTEIGAMINPNEALNILKSPFASTTIIESSFNLVSSIFFPPDWFNTIESGRFKGHSTLYKNAMLSPLTPYQTIYNTIYPENLMRSLEN